MYKSILKNTVTLKPALILLLLLFFIPKASLALSFQSPLKSGIWYQAQDFGVWNNSFSGYHLAEDYTVTNGDELPVYAAADGIVRHVQSHTAYGYVVVIEHNLGNSNYVCSVYGHLRQNGLISLGSVVKGQLIGHLSNDSSENGGCNFTHLHFGIRSGLYSTALDSDGGWRYRGYASLISIRDLWFDPTDFITTQATVYPNTSWLLLLLGNDDEKQFDGEWYSPDYNYSFLINGKIGVATLSNSPEYQVGDIMLKIAQICGNSFTGLQIFTDGNWYSVSGVMSSSGVLEMQGGGFSWVMTKK